MFKNTGRLALGMIAASILLLLGIACGLLGLLSWALSLSMGRLRHGRKAFAKPASLLVIGFFLVNLAPTFIPRAGSSKPAV